MNAPSCRSSPMCWLLRSPTGREIRQRLVEQVTSVVRWTETVTWLAGQGGVTQLVELGTGRVLTGLAKRIAPDVTYPCRRRTRRS